MKISSYTKGTQCPICKNENLFNNSLGKNVPISLNIWSEKNELSPYDYTKRSGKMVWWKCENDKHKDYQRSINNSTERNFQCPECAKEGRVYNHEDLTGKQFGELKVIEYDSERSNASKQIYWICQCSCGKQISTYSAALKDGRQVTCGNRTIHYSGKNSPTWKGGITPENTKKRMTPKYKTWRQSVYKKDYFTCQCCGKTIKEIELHAHHILNMSSHPEIEYEIKNGITLCKNCHYTIVKGSFHNMYGTINNTPEQLEKYINDKRKIIGIKDTFSIKEYLNAS